VISKLGVVNCSAKKKKLCAIASWLLKIDNHNNEFTASTFNMQIAI
jgi:hypothetical protein